MIKQVPSKFEKFIMHLPIWFSKKAFYRYLPFLFECLNDKILKDFDKGFMSDMIPTEFQNAFEIIHCDILLQKWYATGFSKNSVHCLKSYLSNKLLLVDLGNILSHSASASCGTPKALFWGSLLFLIYLNDMPQVVHNVIFFSMLIIDVFLVL